MIKHPSWVPTEEALAAGQEPVPGWVLTRRIGAGAFAEVWEARNHEGTLAALKFLDCHTKPSQVITSEIRTLLKFRELQHPHLIRLHDVCAGPRFLVLIMERADRNLADLHQAYLEKTGKRIPAPRLLDLLSQAAEALDFLAEPRARRTLASSEPLQHCDVKPSNLLLIGDCLKVADFGLCRTEFRSPTTPYLIGTPFYAPPELYQGRATSRTDQYSLAVTYCELCMGARPFRETEPASRTSPALSVDLRRVRESEVPVLARALDPSWLNRWPNCQSFIAALRKALLAPRRGGRKSTGRQL